MKFPMSAFDLQVNGYAGVDFNAPDLRPDTLHAACSALEADGVAGILVAIITDGLPAMAAKLEQLVRYRGLDPLLRKIIRGFHIEGPFLRSEKGYAGAHPIEHILAPSVDGMKRLIDASAGLARLVTLAPEQDTDQSLIRYLDTQGVIVAAGHCNPSLEELERSIDAGLSLFTHLGNGCPAMLARHDNIIQRVLSLSERLWISFIPDGVHVPFTALRNYFRCAGLDRCLVTTDAMAGAGAGPGRYTLSHLQIDVGEDLIARGPNGSNLAGSTITMPGIREHLSKRLHMREEEIDLLTAVNPRKTLKMD
jgi:N-acetylglucosamine-6-phosphate deacetylase